MIMHICYSQVFQLKTLVVSGPLASHPIFTVYLNGVTIDKEEVKGAIACVQDIGCNPLFIQRNFFSETVISMLNTAVASKDAVKQSS